jgi:AcrR family transcriptional regulator
VLDKPPLQSRSQETLDRIVDAAASLLQERPFEDVTVRDIARRARCPTGSFYARFKSKDDLLPYLYLRYDAVLAGHVSAKLAKVPWGTLDLRGLCARGIELMIDEYVERRWLLREMALYARRHPKALPRELVSRRAQVHGRPVELLLLRREEIAHPNPERAVEVGLYTAAGAARDAILFGDAPHAAVTRISTDALKAVLSHSLYHFLAQPCLPPHACCSPPPAPRSASSAKRGRGSRR